MSESVSEFGEMLGLESKREIGRRILDSLAPFFGDPFADIIRVHKTTFWELMERHGIAIEPGVDYARDVRLNRMPLWKECFVESTGVDPHSGTAQFVVKNGDVLSIPGRGDIILKGY